MSDLLDVPVTTLQGEATTLRALSGGGAALVVNVASRCGLTPQYEGLEALQKEYGARGLTVVGVPCNQFKGQEPGTAAEIAEFCSATYGVTFPMTEKVDVNGPGAHPIFQELTGRPMPRARRATSSGTSRSCSWPATARSRAVPSEDPARLPRDPGSHRGRPPRLSQEVVGTRFPRRADSAGSVRRYRR